MGSLELIGSWTQPEVDAVTAALASLPRAWTIENEWLQAIAREPVLVDGPPDAPGHSKYDPSTRSIVLYDKGVYHRGQIDHTQLRRSLYHELAHSILRSDESILPAWQLATQGDGFVDEYARTGPDEDFCDTFSEYFLHRAATERVAPRKVAFLDQLTALAQGEKVAMMNFFNGFADELVKEANPLRRLLSRAAPAAKAGRMAALAPKLLRGGAIAGGAGLAGAAIGKKKGHEKGIEEGAAGLEEGMQMAYSAGVRRGAMAYHEALLQRMKASGGGGKSK